MNRRYYDPQTGRYITQDPIGLAGGDNQYRYGEADPANVSDPTGECPWCVAFALCMAECGITTAVINAATGECNDWGNTAKDCAIGCAAGMGLGWLAGQGFKWLKRGWDALPCVYSFPADTLVHVKPDEAKAKDASLGKSALSPIGNIKVGDEVLAFSEWKDQGKSPKMDRRLSYEKVTDVYTSYKAQTLVHLTLDDGETLTATEGHPFKTTDGWRDAILLKKGGKLLLKGGDGDADAERTGTITDVQAEQRTLPVYNLEVANGHTYFVGIDGELVHNGCLRRPYIRNWVREQVDRIAPRTRDGRPIDPNTRRPIDVKPDIGHKPGNEFWRERRLAEQEGLTQKEFNNRMNDPSKYQLENPADNRSHRYEMPK